MTRTVRFTPRQRQIYDYIRTYTADKGYPPKLEEIAEHIGVAAPSTVHEHLSQMEAKGILRRTYHKHRSMELATAPVAPAVEIPLVGSVIAGLPTESYAVQETVSVPAQMVGRGKHFALRVMGSRCATRTSPKGPAGRAAHGSRGGRRSRHRSRRGAGDHGEALLSGTAPVRLQPSNRDMRPIRWRRRTCRSKASWSGCCGPTRAPEPAADGARCAQAQWESPPAVETSRPRGREPHSTWTGARPRGRGSCRRTCSSSPSVSRSISTAVCTAVTR